MARRTTLNDMILVSVDDHIIEPPHLFEGRLPAAYAARAPKFITDPARGGAQAWTWEYGAAGSSFLNAVVTLPKEEWGLDPSHISQIRPGCYDVDARVRDMDANGIAASMNFGSFQGMAGNFFAKASDRELALHVVRAYNDWHIDEWCGSHPGRFIALPIPPLWSPELAAEEVRRVARKGATAISFSEDPESLGFPSIHSGAWDVFFKACVDEDVTIAIHIASGASGLAGGPETPIDVAVTLPCWNALPCAANLLWSKSLQKFPTLRIALSEGGTSWIPGFLDRMERHYDNQKWTGADLGGLSPTEVFRRHFLACFICDPSGLLLRDRIGIDNISYEVDYPHSDCTWPNSPEELWEHLEGADCNDVEIAKISHENALRWLRFDLFKHLPKAQATVGALRARAADLDTRIRSKEEYMQAYRGTVGA